MRKRRGLPRPCPRGLLGQGTWTLRVPGSAERPARGGKEQPDGKDARWVDHEDVSENMGVQRCGPFTQEKQAADTQVTEMEFLPIRSVAGLDVRKFQK